MYQIRIHGALTISRIRHEESGLKPKSTGLPARRLLGLHLSALPMLLRRGREELCKIGSEIAYLEGEQGE